MNYHMTKSVIIHRPRAFLWVVGSFIIHGLFIITGHRMLWYLLNLRPAKIYKKTPENNLAFGSVIIGDFLQHSCINIYYPLYCFVCGLSDKINLRHGGYGVPLANFSAIIFFLQIAERKTAARSAIVLRTFYIHLFPSFQKTSARCHLRPGQATRPDKKKLPKYFVIVPWPQFLKDQYETYGSWQGCQYLQNVYLGILISVTKGQVNFAI